jgi:anti-sigma factor RsiW
MSCEEWREDISAWFDGELTLGRRSEVDAHLKSCGDCRRLARQFEKLAHLAHSVPSPRAGSHLTNAAIALVRARELRRGAGWRVTGMLWPKLSLAISGLAVAGFLAIMVGRDGFGEFPFLGHRGSTQNATSANQTSILPRAGSLPPASSKVALGAPPIVGNLIVDNSAAGTERLAALVHSLGGKIDAVDTPEQSAVYVSVPQDTRTMFEAGLPKIGKWQHAPSTSFDSGATVIGIRILQRP